MTNTVASPFCHIVIPAPDLPKAQAFYECVFGWQVTPNNPGQGYWFFRSGNVGGAFDASACVSGDGVVLVLQVEDMTETIERIVQYGGTIIQGRSSLGEAAAGFDAYFLDPNENKLGIHSEE